MSDTPETDAKASTHIGFYSCATVPAEFCRSIERERNKLHREIIKLRASDFFRLKKERDESKEQNYKLNDV